jgi:hypothetical protein
MNAPLTPEECKTRGQDQRESDAARRDGEVSERPPDYDPVARLMWQGETRRPDLLPLRYSRMLANPLSFYRGNALLMAEDLARGPARHSRYRSAVTRTSRTSICSRRPNVTWSLT